MKKIVFLLFLSLNISGFSQVKFLINGCNEYLMSWAGYDYYYNNGAQTWNTQDLTQITPVVTDMVLVEGADPVQHGNCTMDQACSGSATILNSAALNGKIAVIRRGNCSFGSKALAAQQAGAVACILVNYNYETFEIAGGVDGPSVTIPTIMVGKLAGEAICDAINSGTAVGFIGNVDGYYMNNLSISNKEAYRANRGLDVAAVYDATNSTGKNQTVNLGVLVHNYGISNQTNIQVTCDISMNGSSIYNQAVNVPSLTSSSDVWVDFPPYINLTETNQHFNITYSVSSTLTDDSPCDNQQSIPFAISPTKFSYAGIDPQTNNPIATGGIQANNIVDHLKVCNHFIDSNANFLAAESVSFQAFTYDPYFSTSLLANTVNVEVYEWENILDIYDVTNPSFFSSMDSDTNKFTLLNSNAFFYQGNYQDSLITVDFPSVVPLQNNKHYLFCTSIETNGNPNFVESFYFRTDDTQDYTYNIGESYNAPSINNGSPTTVAIVDGIFYPLAWGLDKPSSMVVNFSTCFSSYIDSISSCTPITWQDGYTYSISTNSPFIAFTDINGCDSIVRLNLTMLNNSSTDVVSTCQNSFTWIDGNTYTSDNNTATYTLTNMNGCDSVITLNLTFDEISSIDVIVDCSPITWIDGNTYSSNNNTASYNYTNGAVNGCDSIVYLNFTLDAVNAGVTYYDGELHAIPPSGYTYQWLGCDGGYTQISGETSNVFTPLNDGYYAVIISNSNCSDTSNCFFVDDVGINELKDLNINIYPNPVNNQLTVLLNDKVSFNVKLIDANGKIIYSKFNNYNQLIINLSDYKPGVYFIKVSSNNGVRTEKIIIL